VFGDAGASNPAAKETWDVTLLDETGGHVVLKDQGFKAIKSTKIGKVGGMMGDLKWIWATELAKADGGATTEGLIRKYFALRPRQLALATIVNTAELFWISIDHNCIFLTANFIPIFRQQLDS
jgi:hypothetical protein